MAKIRPISDRFYEKVMAEPNSGCWLWTGCVNNKGYGQIGLGGPGSKHGPILLAHRLSFEIHKSPIPAGMSVLHSCDTPACVNPSHLRLGTLADNSRDCVCRGRHRGGSPSGEAQYNSKLTEEQVSHIKQRAMLQTEYAALYGVTKGAISQIWTGRSWAHVK